MGPDGNLYLSGGAYSEVQVTFPFANVVPVDLTDVFEASLAPDGAVRWTRLLHGNPDHLEYAMTGALTPDGAEMVSAGYRYAPAQGYDVFFTRTPATSLLGGAGAALNNAVEAADVAGVEL